MIYLIFGTILALLGLGLMKSGINNLSFLGMLALIIGVFIILKGRGKINKQI